MELIMDNQNNFNDKISYEQAVKKVKKIKSFYTHAAVYIVINIMIVIVKIQELKPNESFFVWENLSVTIFWGIGLLSHGLSTFAPDWFLGKNWEEKKIKEFMQQENDMKNRWE
ncbi:MAG: 2TM domain-containing protein [Flavobacterium sp.]